MNKKCLIVVDYQKDFYHPDGNLYVPGSETIQENIEKIIPEFDDVIFTYDWHPSNHCSFNVNGGTWPVHCVRGTEGASVPKSMIELAKRFHVVYKGMDATKEEYGAFMPNTAASDLLSTFADYEVVVCGLAGNFCVLETLKNVCNIIDPSNVKVYMDGIKFIEIGDDYTSSFLELAHVYNLKNYND